MIHNTKVSLLFSVFFSLMKGDRRNLKLKGLSVLYHACNSKLSKCRLCLAGLSESHRKGCPVDRTALQTCCHQPCNAPHPRRRNSLPICFLMLFQGLLPEPTLNSELVNIYMEMPLLGERRILGEYPK